MTDYPAIEFNNVFYSYDSTPVLEDVSFTVDRGEFISVVGPNGGGKTTLIYLILGLRNAHRGSIRVLGKSPKEALKKIGYMPQSLNYDSQFPITVLDVVLMARLGDHWGGPFSGRDKQMALDSLREVDVSELADRPFAKLSGGQRQRVMIARSLACEPELLLLDEPTANVDKDTESMLHDFLQKLQERMTIMLVSHDLGFVTRAVKSVICVNRRVVRHPTAEITPETIRELYKGEMRVILHDRHFKNGEGHHGGIH